MQSIVVQQPFVSSTLLLLLLGTVAPVAAMAQATPAGLPAFTAEGTLLLPDDYREWVHVTTGLGMTYGPSRVAEGETPQFDNVFVTPASYRAFRETGRWPERTMFILEVRNSEVNRSINVGGYTQGTLRSIEASVKDSDRFPGNGWAYFHFEDGDAPGSTAAPLPETATCYACHSQNAASDNTFVQFYPTLFEVAQRLSTLREDFDASH